MQLLSQLDPARHMVFGARETEVGRWLGREFPSNRELFVYFHRGTGNWVIGYWHNREHSVFHDLMNLGPTGYEKLSKVALLARLNPDHSDRDTVRHMADTEYRTLRRMTDESLTESEEHRPRKIQIVKPRG